MFLTLWIIQEKRIAKVFLRNYERNERLMCMWVALTDMSLSVMQAEMMRIKTFACLRDELLDPNMLSGFAIQYGVFCH